VAPESVRPGRWHDPAAARALLVRFIAENKDLWPDLPAALAFVDAGVPDFAGEVMVPVWQELIDPDRSGDPARAARIRAIGPDARASRELWAVTHAWAPLSAASLGLDRMAANERERRDALALAFPVAWPDVVWPAARDVNVDPLWLLALMRQESHFHTTAVSPSGAVGLLQVMPSTGALIAHDLGIDDFAPRDLFEPVMSARFGAWYLSRLLDRFGGSLVLATAAYNAGPEAVSGWWGGGAAGLEMDAFAELIPVDETREYVVKVMGWYGRYVAAYAPPGARVALAFSGASEDPAGIAY
jgi:soluble lytic murein transglycosylase-like protein